MHVVRHDYITTHENPVVASLLRESNEDVVDAGIRQQRPTAIRAGRKKIDRRIGV
jgi:hypothetical protein